MEIRKDYRRMLTLEMLADDDMQYDEIAPFYSAMKKIHEDSSKVGFQNRFTINERTVLRSIWEQLNENAQTTVETTNKETGQGT